MLISHRVYFLNEPKIDSRLPSQDLRTTVYYIPNITIGLPFILYDVIIYELKGWVLSPEVSGFGQAKDVRLTAELRG